MSVEHWMEEISPVDLDRLEGDTNLTDHSFKRENSQMGDQGEVMHYFCACFKSIGTIEK